MQVSDSLNILLPLKYPVKLIGTAVLNYNLLLDKADHKIVPIIFSFNIVKKTCKHTRQCSDCQISY